MGNSTKIDWREAKEIMGENFFGLSDWNANFRQEITDDEVLMIPWPESVLNGECPFCSGRTVSETHFVFLGVKTLSPEKTLTVLEWQKQQEALRQPRLCQDDWYREKDFANEKTCKHLRWYLVLREIIPGSVNKTYLKQLEMLPGGYEPASAVVEVSKNILNFYKNRVRPNRFVYGTCKDQTQTKELGGPLRVAVGKFSKNNDLDITFRFDNSAYPNFGLTASRIPDC